jgi:hypothetical protein
METTATEAAAMEAAAMEAAAMPPVPSPGRRLGRHEGRAERRDGREPDDRFMQHVSLPHFGIASPFLTPASDCVTAMA